ncbi:hypothetical protein SAMN00790413_04323 [Deinococcus hopiensis KR-140]|uniref:Uncharacterized protein n=1 Tax=Deinococcus hopiensis KR-140 TaxID=695939 RepID=A0A1W1UQ95_9DEIO|nr:hypothetical protein SAMN00790413_04323 [Deinococcus hopiensis KR-140]
MHLKPTEGPTQKPSCPPCTPPPGTRPTERKARIAQPLGEPHGRCSRQGVASLSHLAARRGHRPPARRAASERHGDRLARRARRVPADWKKGSPRLGAWRLGRATPVNHLGPRPVGSGSRFIRDAVTGHPERTCNAAPQKGAGKTVTQRRGSTGADGADNPQTVSPLERSRLGAGERDGRDARCPIATFMPDARRFVGVPA